MEHVPNICRTTQNIDDVLVQQTQKRQINPIICEEMAASDTPRRAPRRQHIQIHYDFQVPSAALKDKPRNSCRILRAREESLEEQKASKSEARNVQKNGGVVRRWWVRNRAEALAGGTGFIPGTVHAQLAHAIADTSELPSFDPGMQGAQNKSANASPNLAR